MTGAQSQLMSTMVRLQRKFQGTEHKFEGTVRQDELGKYRVRQVGRRSTDQVGW